MSQSLTDSTSSIHVIVLSQNGSLLLLDIESGKIVILFDASSLSEDERIKDFAVSPTGKHLVVCTDKIKVYILEKLIHSSIQKPKAVKPKQMPRTASKGRRMTNTSKHVSVLKDRKRLADFDALDEAEPLTPAKLKHILTTFGQFPSKYRMFIWRMILKLPDNHQAFATLVDKDTHPAFTDLHKTYPVKDQRLFRALQKTLSHLAHWAPIFGETSLAPLIVFPFVKLFINNQLVCFEVVATVIINYLQHFFEFFPNPAVNVLGAIENILCFHAPAVLEHFAATGVSATLYAWPLLETLFSEVLIAKDWLIFFDYTLTSHPSFILFAVVAYSLLNKQAILNCTEREDLKFFFRHHSPVSIHDLVTMTANLSASTPAKIHPSKNGFFKPFQALPSGQYPIFNGYPEMIVNYQIREKDRLSKEAEEVAKQAGIVRDMDRRAAARHIKDASLRLPKEDHLRGESELRKVLRLGTSASAREEQRQQIKKVMEEVQKKEIQLLNAERKKLLLSGVASASDLIVEDDHALTSHPASNSDENKDNSVSASQTSSIDNGNFNRAGRQEFEARERELLRHIRGLRAKLATSGPKGRGDNGNCQLEQPYLSSPPLDVGTGVDAAGDSVRVQSKCLKGQPHSAFTLLGGGDGIP